MILDLTLIFAQATALASLHKKYRHVKLFNPQGSKLSADYFYFFRAAHLGFHEIFLKCSSAKAGRFSIGAASLIAKLISAVRSSIGSLDAGTSSGETSSYSDSI